jgi:hypothetical protein
MPRLSLGGALAALALPALLAPAAGAGRGADDPYVATQHAAREMVDGFRHLSGMYVRSLETAKRDAQDCQAEIVEESLWSARRVGRRGAGLVGATMTDFFQETQQYEQCSLGAHASRLNEYMAANTTCVGTHFKDGSLSVSSRLVEGDPKVKLACGSPACYECLAETGCKLDHLLSAVTGREIDAEAPMRVMPPRRTYFGNRQLQFDGKRQFAKLPQLGKYTDEFTFEGWFAWTPTMKHATNGPTVRFFDFFAEDPARKAAYEDSAAEFRERHKRLKNMNDKERAEWQKELARERVKAAEANAEAMKERRAHEDRIAAEKNQAHRPSPFEAVRAEAKRLGVSRDAATTTTLADLSENDIFGNADIDDELVAYQRTYTDAEDPLPHKLDDGSPLDTPRNGAAPEPQGEYGLKFSKRPPGPPEPDHVTQISFSPGQFVPESEMLSAGATARTPMGMRLVMDRAEIMCDMPFPHGAWSHLAVVVHKRGSSVQEDCCWSVHVYVDTRLVCTKNKVKLSEVSLERILFMVDSNYLGRDQKGHRDSYFEGFMDNIRIWDTARTLPQIREFAHKQISASSPGLVATYGFDELRTSTVAKDRTKNMLDGILGDNGEWRTCPRRVAMRSTSLPHFDGNE